MKFSVVIIGLGNIGMLYDINLPKKKNILTHFFIGINTQPAKVFMVGPAKKI